MARLAPLERFMSKVDVGRGDDACWVWTKGMQGKYGSFYFEGRTVGAHRWSYEHHTGETIPEGMEILHQCDNPPCVNPRHLRVGTHGDNMREVRERGNGPKPRGLTHCPRKHAYTDANTYVYDGYKSCRTCRREAWRDRNTRTVA